MSRRKIAVIGGGAVVLALGVAGYAVAVSRNCDENWGVPRGSFRYRLCGVDREFLASIPLEATAGPPTFSWRLAEGTKPGWLSLRYDSRQPPAEVRAGLAAFLKRSDFVPQRSDEEYEWWSDANNELGIAVKDSGHGSTSVEIIQNTGFD